MRKQPFSGMRPPRFTEAKTILDPVTGEEDTIVFQQLDSPLENLAMDYATRLVLQYVGFPEEGIAPRQEFPVFAFELSENLCRTAAQIFAMQVSRPDGGEVYSLDELLAFAASDEAQWKGLIKATNEVNGAADKLKNASRAAAGSGSPTPSASTSLTRRSSPETTQTPAP